MTETGCYGQISPKCDFLAMSACLASKVGCIQGKCTSYLLSNMVVDQWCFWAVLLPAKYFPHVGKLHYTRVMVLFVFDSLFFSFSLRVPINSRPDCSFPSIHWATELLPHFLYNYWSFFSSLKMFFFVFEWIWMLMAVFSGFRNTMESQQKYWRNAFQIWRQNHQECVFCIAFSKLCLGRFLSHV